MDNVVGELVHEKRGHSRSLYQLHDDVLGLLFAALFQALLNDVAAELAHGEFHEIAFEHSQKVCRYVRHHQAENVLHYVVAVT